MKSAILEYSLYFIIYIYFNDEGDEFALRDGNSLFCKMDNDALEKLAQADIESTAIDFRETTNTLSNNSNNNNSSSNNNSSEFGSMSGKI